MATVKSQLFPVDDRKQQSQPTTHSYNYNAADDQGPVLSDEYYENNSYHHHNNVHYDASMVRSAMGFSNQQMTTTMDGQFQMASAGGPSWSSLGPHRDIVAARRLSMVPRSVAVSGDRLEWPGSGAVVMGMTPHCPNGTNGDVSLSMTPIRRASHPELISPTKYHHPLHFPPSPQSRPHSTMTTATTPPSPLDSPPIGPGRSDVHLSAVQPSIEASSDGLPVTDRPLIQVLEQQQSQPPLAPTLPTDTIPIEIHNNNNSSNSGGDGAARRIGFKRSLFHEELHYSSEPVKKPRPAINNTLDLLAAVA
jgi:hypothetical protein